MVGMGLAMLALGAWGAAAWALKRLDESKWLYRALVLASPSGFVAVLAGWIAAEVGRQPWVIYGVLRTRDAVSPITTVSRAVTPASAMAARHIAGSGFDG